MKKIFIFLLLILINISVFGQKRSSNFCEKSTVVSFNIGGGIHDLLYKIGDCGKKSFCPGFLVNADIKQYLTNNLGVGIGINFQSFGASSDLNYIQSIENAIDEKSRNFVHRTYFNNLKENQSLLALGIPIGGYYQVGIQNNIVFKAGIGVMPSFIINSKYKTKSGNIQTRGYYPQYNLEIKDMDNHNLYSDQDFNDKNNFKTFISTFVQAGITYCIDKQLSVSANIYFTYSLNSVSKDNSDYIYNPDFYSSSTIHNPKYNGVCNSNIVSKVNPMSVGLMLGLNYNLGNLLGNGGGGFNAPKL